MDSHWLGKRQECVQCDGPAPVCNCAANEQCILTGRSCSQCPSIECMPNPASSGGKSINPGVIAGPVVAALVILGVVALWWLRRKRRRDLARVEELAQRARKAEAAGFHLSSNPGSPGPGSARSARSARSERSSQRFRTQPPRSPDPNAPVNPDYYDENGQLRAPHRQDDPFSDRQSVSTTGTGDSHAIPIKYLPRAPSDEALSRILRTGGKQAPADAARALDEARNNLFKNGAAPMRPARSPDLDLRLNPQGPPSSFHHLDTNRSPQLGGSTRDSYLSDNSGAPSYLSGATDIHLDAPKIVTSRQVQVGRLQQAEVVQLGRPLHQQQQQQQQNNMENLGGLPSPTGTNPFGGSQDGSHDNHLYAPAPLSPATFGSRTLGSDVSGVAAEGAPSYRTLTPVSSHHTHHGNDVDAEEEDLAPTPTTGDLRFSMGTFSRDSVSTMGTSRYLAQALPPPTPGRAFDPRESMASSRSGADSVLHGFPMIPPNQSGSVHHSPIPQSTSVSTLDHAAATMPSRPPTSYNTPRQTPAHARNTQGSVGLGGYSFVPPPQPSAGAAGGKDSAGLLTDGPPTLPHPTKGRNTIGMSTTSEGLGGFEFNFDRPDTS